MRKIKHCALIFSSLAILSCSPQSEVKAPSAAKVVPQIYYLFEKPTHWWAFPSRSLQDSLGVRVVEAKAETEESAKKLLQTWNARPVDLLVLGPGLPQRSFESLKLPSNPKRKVLFLEPKKLPSAQNTLSLQVDAAELSRFLKQLCKRTCKKGCQLFGETSLLKKSEIKPSLNDCSVGLGLSKVSSEYSQMWLNLDLPWEALIREVLQSADTKGSNKETQLLLRISEARILAQLGAAAPALQRPLLDQFIKTYTLENL